MHVVCHCNPEVSGKGIVLGRILFNGIKPHKLCTTQQTPSSESWDANYRGAWTGTSSSILHPGSNGAQHSEPILHPGAAHPHPGKLRGKTGHVWHRVAGAAPRAFCFPVSFFFPPAATGGNELIRGIRPSQWPQHPWGDCGLNRTAPSGKREDFGGKNPQIRRISVPGKAPLMLI